jgi:hypothetical protein
VFACLHVNALATEADSFHGEPQALLSGCLAAQFDFATRTDDSLPGEVIEGLFAQELCDRSMIERISGGGGYLTVGRYLSFGHGADDAAKGGIALLIWAQRILEDTPLEILRNGRAMHVCFWRMRGGELLPRLLHKYGSLALVIQTSPGPPLSDVGNASKLQVLRFAQDDSSF